MPSQAKNLNEMIQDAIYVLASRGGSTRQEIWKVISARNMNANHKTYLLRLRRLAKENNVVSVNPKNNHRFMLDAKLR